MAAREAMTEGGAEQADRQRSHQAGRVFERWLWSGLGLYTSGGQFLTGDPETDAELLLMHHPLPEVPEGPAKFVRTEHPGRWGRDPRAA